MFTLAICVMKYCMGRARRNDLRRACPALAMARRLDAYLQSEIRPTRGCGEGAGIP